MENREALLTLRSRTRQEGSQAERPAGGAASKPDPPGSPDCRSKTLFEADDEVHTGLVLAGPVDAVGLVEGVLHARRDEQAIDGLHTARKVAVV